MLAGWSTCSANRAIGSGKATASPIRAAGSSKSTRLGDESDARIPARCNLCPLTTGLDTRGRCSFGGGGSIIECTGSIAAQSCGAAKTSSTARHLAAMAAMDA